VTDFKIYKRENRTYNEALERTSVFLQLEKKNNGSKSFMFTGVEAGVGTTISAINIAIELAKQENKVVFLDADFRKFNSVKKSCDFNRIGISDYVLEDKKTIFYDTNFANLTYIPCGFYTRDVSKLLNMDKFEELVKKLEMVFDYVIIDTVAVSTVADACTIAGKIDSVILVVMENVSLKESLVNANLQMKKIGAKVLGVVVNKVDRTDYRNSLRDFDYFHSMRLYRNMKNKKIK